MPTRHSPSARLVAGCSLAVVVLAAWASHAAAQDVEWRTDYGKARREAAQKGLPLVIDFSTENCFWCRQLELRTFTDPAVVALLNQHCIPLHIDAGRNPDLTDKMNIQSFPTLVYASPEGRVLGYQEGFIEAPVFRDQVARAVSAVSTPAVSTPDWMTRDYAEAVKAAGQKDFARALTLLKGLVEDGKDRPIQTQARQLMTDVERQAADRLTSAKQLADRGETAQALKTAGEVVHQFAGADAARAAADFAATLTGRVDASEQQRRDRSRDLLAQARDDFRTQQFLCCLDRCEALTSQFGDLPEAAEAARLSADIKSNTEWAKAAADQMSDRLGVLYLSLADTCLKKGQPQQAALYLEHVMQTFPNTRHAEAAAVRLTQIQGQPPMRTEDFKKSQE
ncbi:MAG TPA: thioredoxin family protein [Gemmataceae bacterium]|nr:thioredoxin family protein [Gemmataceae bacterium]